MAAWQPEFTIFWEFTPKWQNFTYVIIGKILHPVNRKSAPPEKKQAAGKRLAGYSEVGDFAGSQLQLELVRDQGDEFGIRCIAVDIPKVNAKIYV